MVLPPSRSRSLHATVLRRLLERGGSVSTARLVHHATLAGDVAAVRRYAPEAAREASALGAHREAAAHYRTALDHAPADDLEARATLSEGRAYECYLVNQFDDAVAARETALGLRRQQDNLLKVGDNLCWLSRLAYIRGRGQDARKLATEAVQILEQLPPGPELAMAYSAMSQRHMLSEDNLAAVDWGQRALRIAEPLGLTETVVHALNNVGTAELQMGDLAGRAKLERSLELALAHGMHEHAGRAYINLADHALVVRDYDRARQLLADGLAYMRERDLDSWTCSPSPSAPARIWSRVSGGKPKRTPVPCWARRPRRFRGSLPPSCWAACACGRVIRSGAVARRGARAGVGDRRHHAHRAGRGRPRRGGLAPGRQ